jgi:predicted PurR-regulated permease PerM
LSGKPGFPYEPHTNMIAKILQDKKILASIVVTFLFLFVIYASIPFISAFFGALIIAFIFRPLDKFLRREWKFSKQLSAWTIIIISIILIIIPTIFLVQGLIEQVKLLPDQLSKMETLQENLNEQLPFNVNIDKQFIVENIMPFFTKSITGLFSNVLQAFAIFFLLFFLLYYFTIYSEEIKKAVYEIIPFNKTHKEDVVEKFRAITYSTIVGTFLIAIIQGGLLAINFYFFGVPNALFWGFVAMILSFLPIIGVPIIWIPVAVLFIISGNPLAGISLIIIGIMISLIDNILRPIINDKYGKIHPVVSIVGIYIGISQFGLIGIFIGPLIVAYLVLFWTMYKKEYMDKNKSKTSKKKVGQNHHHSLE